jgi:hypothetical protein
MAKNTLFCYLQMTNSDFLNVNFQIFFFHLIYKCRKIRKFRIQSIAGDHFSSPKMEIKKKSGLPPQRYIGLNFL